MRAIHLTRDARLTILGASRRNRRDDERTMSDSRIAVVGAGMAGLACANELARADARVTVFEHARGLGGRLATRRRGNLAFDHGAQYFTARGHGSLAYAKSAVRLGAAERWKPRILEDDRLWPEPIEEWWVGKPGMSGLLRPLARNLDVRTGVGVHELLPSQRGWELLTDSGRSDQVYRALAIAIPAPQALQLLGRHGRAFHHLHGVRMGPCWAALLAFASPLDIGADCMRWSQGPLAWAACNSSKPGRERTPATWVLHASPEWSREHLEADATVVAPMLLEAFVARLGVPLPTPMHLAAHRWRHAIVEQPLGLPCLVDEKMSAGACGDWCIAPRVEAAYESGRALAHSLLSMVGLSLPMKRA